MELRGWVLGVGWALDCALTRGFSLPIPVTTVTTRALLTALLTALFTPNPVTMRAVVGASGVAMAALCCWGRQVLVVGSVD